MANSVEDGPAQLPLDELVASRSTAYEMVRSGALRCVRIGRRIVVPPSAVAEVWRRAPELPLAQ
jgi:excisionase family DNA binding protein